jgi:hypothetical protein
MHCGAHPFAGHVQKLVSNLLIVGQPSEAHAFSCVFHAFLVGGHGALPVLRAGGSAIGLSAAGAWIKRPLPAMHHPTAGGPDQLVKM